MSDATSTSTKSDAEQWPSVPLAYDFACSSYQLAFQRLDAVDSRIQNLQAFAATITVATPVIVASIQKDIDFRSPWLALALIAFAAIVLIGVISRVWGSVRVVSPQLLYEHWLHYSEWEFKKNMVYWAAEHFRRNTNMINAKGWVANGVTGLFALESALLLTWALTEV